MAQAKIEISDEMMRAGGAELQRQLDTPESVCPVGPYTAQSIAEAIFKAMSNVHLSE